MSENNNYEKMKAAEWRGHVGATLDSVVTQSNRNAKAIKILSDRVLLLPQEIAEGANCEFGALSERIGNLEDAKSKEDAVAKWKKAVFTFIVSMIGGLIVVSFSVFVKSLF